MLYPTSAEKTCLQEMPLEYLVCRLIFRGRTGAGRRQEWWPLCLGGDILG